MDMTLYDDYPLSQHFTLREMLVTATGYGNTPSDAVLPNLRRLAMTMELVRSALGDHPIKISSAFRSALVNHAVGGAKTSAHLIGLACDFTCWGFGSPTEICIAVIDANIDYDQLIDEERTGPDGSRSNWVHLGIGPRTRHQVLTSTTPGKYTPGLRQP